MHTSLQNVKDQLTNKLLLKTNDPRQTPTWGNNRELLTHTHTQTILEQRKLIICNWMVWRTSQNLMSNCRYLLHIFLSVFVSFLPSKFRVWNLQVPSFQVLLRHNGLYIPSLVFPCIKEDCHLIITLLLDHKADWLADECWRNMPLIF